jgi:hypothetical protein
MSLKGLATRLSKYSLPQWFLKKFGKVKMSKVMLEGKPNCTKILASGFLLRKGSAIELKHKEKKGGKSPDMPQA